MPISQPSARQLCRSLRGTKARARIARRMRAYSSPTRSIWRNVSSNIWQSLAGNPRRANACTVGPAPRLPTKPNRIKTTALALNRISNASAPPSRLATSGPTVSSGVPGTENGKVSSNTSINNSSGNRTRRRRGETPPSPAMAPAASSATKPALNVCNETTVSASSPARTRRARGSKHANRSKRSASGCPSPARSNPARSRPSCIDSDRSGRQASAGSD